LHKYRDGRLRSLNRLIIAASLSHTFKFDVPGVAKAHYQTGQSALTDKRGHSKRKYRGKSGSHASHNSERFMKLQEESLTCSIDNVLRPGFAKVPDYRMLSKNGNCKGYGELQRNICAALFLAQTEPMSSTI
jgi:hypothetical protein